MRSESESESARHEGMTCRLSTNEKMNERVDETKRKQARKKKKN